MINKISGAVAASVCLIVCLILPALAEGPGPDNDHGRYVLHEVNDGYLRLDTQTGDVSLCAKRTVGWACQAVPDDRAVLESEIARLRSENGALKKELLTNGLPLPAGTASDGGGSAGDNTVILRLPSDGEVDSAFAFVGRMWHRLVDAFARAQKQMLNKS